MRLGITYCGRDRKGLWSGTWDAFDKYFGEHDSIESIEWVSVFPNISRWYQKLLTLYSRCFYFKDGNPFELQMYPLFKRKSLKEVKLMGAEWIIAKTITDEFPHDKKFCTYVDADFEEVMKTDINRTKLLFNFYLNYYHQKAGIAYRRQNLIFTQNEWTRQSLMRKFGLEPEKIINVGFGINLKTYEGEKLYDNDLLLIVLRQYNAKVKGLDLLVEALSIVRKQCPNVRLAVVGNEQYKGVDGVDCYVDAPREKTIELFRKATLYVMPSRNEPNGMTYLEALCYKTPFVALNRFATPEFSGNGKWSFLCEKENAHQLADIIIDAMSDKARLKVMGELGQQYVKDTFRWEKVVDKMCSAMKNYKR